MSIKAVVFDYGNVISLPQTGEWALQLERDSGVKAEVIASSFETYRDAFDRGDLAGKDMYRHILEDNGYTDLARDEALCARIAQADMQSWRPCNEAVTQWALGLKQSGYKLAILSNMPYEFLDSYEHEIALFVAADIAVFSCREKLIKPESTIYERLLGRLNIEASQAVFFDDMPRNIDAACALGIHGILWHSLEQAQRDFARLTASLC